MLPDNRWLCRAMKCIGNIRDYFLCSFGCIVYRSFETDVLNVNVTNDLALVGRIDINAGFVYNGIALSRGDIAHALLEID